MAWAKSLDALFQNIMAYGIGQADSDASSNKKSESAMLIYSENSNDTDDPGTIKVFFYGNKQHELVHHSGLKMLVDPVE